MRVDHLRPSQGARHPVVATGSPVLVLPAWGIGLSCVHGLARHREVRVIETYLARLLDESLEAATLGTDTPATEAAKEDGE
jgi:hypothetical protein